MSCQYCLNSAVGRCQYCGPQGAEAVQHEWDQLQHQLAILTAERDRLAGEVVAAKEQLELDRTTCADLVTALDKALDSRFWLTEEGRGSYQWDDDRYREEFRDAAVALKAVIEPMRKMACNLSSSLQTTDQVVKARVDLRAEVERLKEAGRIGVETWRYAAQTAIARAESAEAHAAGLRGALSVYFTNYMQDEAESADDCVCGEEQHRHAVAVKDALARTPAQSLARIKAAALRELAGKWKARGSADAKIAAGKLLDEADRLEAANG